MKKKQSSYKICKAFLTDVVQTLYFWKYYDYSLYCRVDNMVYNISKYIGTWL